ncbi:LysR family transcriptional regulator [Streptomyces collinus]|uniref:LysR family transcriptional regulator n=1 Tax=Streptomyces collinus TaxID=42684 RepID=UPI0036785669
MRLLRELKHRGTLAAVASALSYSPSAISHQLARLESEVGVPLLESAGRYVRLTAQGEILVCHAEAVLFRIDQVEAEMAASMPELTGVVRIASFQTAALNLIPAMLSHLRTLHPLLRVQVAQMERRDAISSLICRDSDIVVDVEYPGVPRPKPADLDSEDLCVDYLHLADVDIVHTGAPGEALRDMANRPWVMEPEGTDARFWSMALCRAAGFEPDVRYESPDLLVHLSLVEDGQAAAFLPSLMCWAYRPAVPVAVLPSHQNKRTIFTTVRRGSGRHPAVEAIRQALIFVSRQSAARPST